MNNRHTRFTALASAGLSLAVAVGQGAPDVNLFFRSASRNERESRDALEHLRSSWKPGHASLLVDIARLLRPVRLPVQSDRGLPSGASPGGDPESDAPDTAERWERRTVSSPVRTRIIRYLERQTGQRFGDDLWRWRRWLWSQPYDPHPDYLAFKSTLFAAIDPRMAEFFGPQATSVIRLDEIEWGGVGVNGIPPLNQPKVVDAASATYLKDSNLVFGIVRGDEARAYPKRILAWHELARDTLGGTHLTIVYCTLCGTVIPYESMAGGVTRTFGTSGLLYRSNKLMFDEETMSLWSTFEGRPVVGRLAGQPIQLRAVPVVTTTWGEWRKTHPRTTVLSLETGFTRDYAEGAAYRDYFATDRLMFHVPGEDTRLKNKTEVLTLQLTDASTGSAAPLAIAAEFLRKTPLFAFEHAGRSLVIVTSEKGANRVYEGGESFTKHISEIELQAADGSRWSITEDALVGPHDRRLRRVAASRAFWFGWRAQFPATRLIK